MGLRCYKKYDLVCLRYVEDILTVKSSDEHYTSVYEQATSIRTADLYLCTNLEKIYKYFCSHKDFVTIKDWLSENFLSQKPFKLIQAVFPILTFDYLSKFSNAKYQLEVDIKEAKDYLRPVFPENKTPVPARSEENPCVEINLGSKESFYEPKKLPSEGFVRTHNQEIIEYIKKGKDSTKDYDFSDPSKYIGIAWNRISYWVVVGSSSKLEISEEEVLKCMYKPVFFPTVTRVSPFMKVKLPSAMEVENKIPATSISHHFNKDVLPKSWYTDNNPEVVSWLRNNYGVLITSMNSMYVGVIDNGVRIKSHVSDSHQGFIKHGAQFTPVEKVLKLINSNNLKSETNGTSTKVGTTVSRITNGSRTTGVVVSGRAGKYSITVGHPSNQTISC